MSEPTNRRSFYPTPAWLIYGLLVVEGLLWLSERYGWFWFNEKKGWTVLIGVAVVGGVMLVMLGWFIASLIFRWRFQFSLRSLLIMVVAVAVPCSWLTTEIRAARRQTVAVAAIEMAGGTVEYDWQQDANGKRVRHALPQGPTWLRTLLGINIFEQVKSVEVERSLIEYDHTLGPTHFTDIGLENVKDMPQLEVLSIGVSDVTDAGMGHLEGLGHLRRLELFGTKVTDTGLGHLAKLSQLQELNLWETQVTDAGLPHLAGLSQLRSLNLSETQVTNAGVGYLAGLRQLRHLNLFGTKVTDQGVKKLQQALPDCKIFR